MKYNLAKYSDYLRFITVLVILLITVVILGNQTGEFSTAPVVTYSTDAPEEKLPTESGYVWKGQKNDPKRIVIPKIAVDALVQNVGVDQRQQIAVPNNIHIAGWFVNTVRPGTKGLSIIDGHVNGVATDEGVFKRLSELVIGDNIQIVMGDNSVIEFKVQSNQSIPTAESATVLYSQNPEIESQLNLVTCTGNFDRTARQYDNRQITVLERL